MWGHAFALAVGGLHKAPALHSSNPRGGGKTSKRAAACANLGQRAHSDEASKPRAACSGERETKTKDSTRLSRERIHPQRRGRILSATRRRRVRSARGRASSLQQWPTQSALDPRVIAHGAEPNALRRVLLQQRRDKILREAAKATRAACEVLHAIKDPPPARVQVARRGDSLIFRPGHRWRRAPGI